MHTVLLDILHDIPWDQIFPILFVFLIAPLLAIVTYYQAVKARPTIAWLAIMVFENLGLGFAWSWLYGGGSGSGNKTEGKTSKRKHVRRADQVAASRSEKNAAEGYYPGLINISGTYCFLNSTLQAMASLSYLQPYIEAIHSRAEQLDVPTPILDAFLDILKDLNTPSSSSKPLRPIGLINALSVPVGKSQRSALFYSREHQDAQEFFQLLSEMIKNEAKAVDDEASRDRGLGNLKREPSPSAEALSLGKGSIFDGLTANRRSCMECGYTEAVMHFAFDNLQLTVPRMASCRLEECLADYTRLELLTDCICRKCSMLATYERLQAEAEKHTEAVSSASPEEGSVSSSKKKRAREARKLESRVKAAIDEGRIEEDLKGVKMEKVFSRCSTKQSMIARPPPVLALHLNRSIHYGMGGVKNTCRVIFPEILDLTPFTTSGQLSTTPSAPISTPSPPPTSPNSNGPRRSSTPTPSDPHPQQKARSSHTPQVLYRLSSVVCHYGTHSFGHYVSYRRKPRPPSAGAHRYDPPTLQCPLDCECEKCAVWGPIRDQAKDEEEDTALLGRAKEMPGLTASRWLRISDDSVDEVGIERVLAESAGTFMLYYERIIQPGAIPPPIVGVGVMKSSTPTVSTLVSETVPQLQQQIPIPIGSLTGFQALGSSPLGGILSSSPGSLSSGLSSVPNGTPPSLIRRDSDKSLDTMAASSSLSTSYTSSFSSGSSFSSTSDTASLWAIRSSPRSSEETIKPAHIREGNGTWETRSLYEDGGPNDRRSKLLEARIIRSVYAGRRFGRSTTPGTERDSSPSSTYEGHGPSEGNMHVNTNGDAHSLSKSVPQLSGPKTRSKSQSNHLQTPAQQETSPRSRSDPRIGSGRPPSPPNTVPALAAGLRA